MHYIHFSSVLFLDNDNSCNFYRLGMAMVYFELFYFGKIFIKCCATQVFRSIIFNRQHNFNFDRLVHVYHQDKLKVTPHKNYHCKLVLKNLFLKSVCLTSNLELNHTLIMYTCTPKHTNEFIMIQNCIVMHNIITTLKLSRAKEINLQISQ